MGLPALEENKSKYCLSPKIYQPADDMDGPLGSPRKKKSFSSSSFYEEPNAIYPTIEEQVELCRKIAESLSDDCNLRSKGANMFFKRVKKAEKWIVAESNGETATSVDSAKDLSKLPYVRPSKGGPPKLKLILAPRPLVDMDQLLKEGVDIVEHNAISPEICRTLAQSLHTNKGKGGQIFAKRKKNSEQWVVDEDKVRHLLQERYHLDYPSHSSPEPLVHPRVKALSSEMCSQAIAESVIRAAEAKIMTYPNAVPHMPVILSLDNPAKEYGAPNQWTSDAYKCRAPKGWTGSPTPTTDVVLSQEAPLSIGSSFCPTGHSLETSSSALRRTLSFNNFNASPRAWNTDLTTQFRPVVIKSVKPPSVLVQ